MRSSRSGRHKSRIAEAVVCQCGRGAGREEPHQLHTIAGNVSYSCASLLLANGVPMKQIQEWLGHSDFSTTANIYAHLDYSSKLNSADAMLSGLGIAEAK